MITLAEHERIVAEMDADLRFRRCEIPQLRGDVRGLRRQLQQERETVSRLVAKIRDLEPDAIAHRARLKRDREYHANRRQAREKQAAE